MPRPLFISLACVAAAALAACSGARNDNQQDGAKKSIASDALPAALSGEAGFALAADCSAKLKSVSKLYRALAKQSSDTDAEDFAKRASQRENAATTFAEITERVAGTIGKTPEEAEAAIRDADAAVQTEFDKRPFEDFATWVGNEVDTKCREALTGQS